MSKPTLLVENLKRKGVKTMRKTYLLFIVAFAAGLYMAAGCGGTAASGGGDGISHTVGEALEIAEQVSFVDAQEDVSGSISAGKSMFANASKALNAAADSDYATDEKIIYVFDDSMMSLNMINEILCAFEQTKYSSFLDLGPYIAMVDNSVCAKDTDKSSESSNQSSGETESLEKWVVNGVSATVDTAETIHAWIEESSQDEYDPSKLIYAKATIYEGVTADNPLGHFRIDFLMLAQADGSVFGQGYVESLPSTGGLQEVQFSMAGDNMSESVHAILNVTDDSGYAHAEHLWGFGDMVDEAVYDVAFDANFYLTSKAASDADYNPTAKVAAAGDEKCLSRTTFDEMVFRYGLYDENGARAAIEHPGFGFKFGEFYGYAGYWGIWLPYEALIANGAEILDSEGLAYTLLIAPGRLNKHEQKQITFADIKGASLWYYDDLTGFQSRVSWNGTNFVKNGEQVCTENSGCQIVDTEETVLDFGDKEWVNFWREGQGGLFFQRDLNPDPEVTEYVVLNDDTEMTYDKITVVAPDSDLFVGGEATLYCYQNCLKTGLTTADTLNWMDQFLPESLNVAAPYVYTISAADMTLKLNGVDIDMTGEASSDVWGAGSGSMLTSTVGLEGVWEVWGQPVFYTWEVGPNMWNKYTGLIDGNGDMVVFDPPISLNYVHAAAANDIKYHLEYSGYGELQGIPWKQIEGTDRWYPEITIPDGSEAITDDGNNTLYYIKGLEAEQKMSVVDSSFCSALEIGELSTPDTDFVDPGIGDMPTDVEVLVIKGEIQ